MTAYQTSRKTPVFSKYATLSGTSVLYQELRNYTKQEARTYRKNF